MQRPHERRRAGDEQETGQRQAQKTGGEVRRQARAGNAPAENQNRRAAFGKPFFAARDLRGKFPERRPLKPFAPAKPRERIKSRVAQPDAEEARRERHRPGNRAGGKQQSAPTAATSSNTNVARKKPAPFQSGSHSAICCAGKGSASVISVGTIQQPTFNIHMSWRQPSRTVRLLGVHC